MGTRGTYGFRKNGELHLTYNHYDSYFSGLGQDIVDAIKYAGSTKKLNETFDSIIFIDGSKEPTDAQIEECKKYANLAVSEGSLKDWYCLLRETQGNLIPYIDREIKYIVEDNNFIKNNTWSEYFYIIDLDNDILELGRDYDNGESTVIPLDTIFKSDINLEEYMKEAV